MSSGFFLQIFYFDKVILGCMVIHILLAGCFFDLRYAADLFGWEDAWEGYEMRSDGVPEERSGENYARIADKSSRMMQGLD